VVVVTRCLTGRVASIYGGPGGGHTLQSIGVIGGSDLNASKARVALAVAMGVDPTVDAVRTWFEELG
jgi:L-asparaginase